MVDTGARRCRRGGQTRANSSPTGRREQYRERMSWILSTWKGPGFQGPGGPAGERSNESKGPVENQQKRPQALTPATKQKKARCIKTSQKRCIRSSGVQKIRRQLRTRHTPVTHSSLPQTVVLFCHREAYSFSS
jgi:hypothetical protein